MKNVLRAIILLLPFMLFSKGIIINHSNIDLSKLNKESTGKIMSTLKITYQHTSHGSQLVSGLNALSSHNPTLFKFPSSSSGYHKGIFLNDYGMTDAQDLGHSGDLAWVDATKNILNLTGCDRNVVMWSWCGGCSDNTIEGIDSYLNSMNTLELNYPAIAFVYMTGHLDGTGETGNLNMINERIRDFCIKKDKILFDFADIESYAPNDTTNYMLLNANDACDYNNGNWANNWLATNPTDPLALIAEECTDCAHSNSLNCAIKSVATWQMFKWITVNRFGVKLNVEEDTLINNAILKIYPVPADKEINIEIMLKEKSSLRFDIYDRNGNHVKTLLNGAIREKGLNKDFNFEITDLPIGTYDLRLLVGDEFKTKSFVVVR